MSDKIVKIESEVVAGKAGLLERALEESPVVVGKVVPSDLRPEAEEVFRFLKRVSVDASLRRIVLRVDDGNGSYGAIIGDLFPFKPNQSAEVLTATANDLLGRALADCDISDRETAYVVIAYSTVVMIDEMWFSLFPTDREQGPNKLEALGDLPPPDDAFSILGEMLGKSPALQEMIARRAASGPPIMRVQRTSKTRDWQIAFPTLRLKAGESAATVRQAETYFRGEKLICSARKKTSDGEVANEVDGVYIDNIFVGQMMQSRGPFSTRLFNATQLGGGYKYDTAQPGIDITLTVRNTNDFEVVFDAVMFGRAVE